MTTLLSNKSTTPERGLGATIMGIGGEPKGVLYLVGEKTDAHLGEVLSASGYRVTRVSGLDEAERVIESAPEAFAAVVVDDCSQPQPYFASCSDRFGDLLVLVLGEGMRADQGAWLALHEGGITSAGMRKGVIWRYCRCFYSAASGMPA